MVLVLEIQGDLGQARREVAALRQELRDLEGQYNRLGGAGGAGAASGPVAGGGGAAIPATGSQTERQLSDAIDQLRAELSNQSRQRTVRPASSGTSAPDIAQGFLRETDEFVAAQRAAADDYITRLRTTELSTLEEVQAERDDVIRQNTRDSEAFIERRRQLSEDHLRRLREIDTGDVEGRQRLNNAYYRNLDTLRLGQAETRSRFEEEARGLGQRRRDIDFDNRRGGGGGIGGLLQSWNPFDGRGLGGNIAANFFGEFLGELTAIFFLQLASEVQEQIESGLTERGETLLTAQGANRTLGALEGAFSSIASGVVGLLDDLDEALGPIFRSEAEQQAIAYAEAIERVNFQLTQIPDIGAGRGRELSLIRAIDQVDFGVGSSVAIGDQIGRQGLIGDARDQIAQQAALRAIEFYRDADLSPGFLRGGSFDELRAIGRPAENTPLRLGQPGASPIGIARRILREEGDDIADQRAELQAFTGLLQDANLLTEDWAGNVSALRSVLQPYITDQEQLNELIELYSAATRVAALQESELIRQRTALFGHPQFPNLSAPVEPDRPVNPASQGLEAASPAARQAAALAAAAARNQVAGFLGESLPLLQEETRLLGEQRELYNVLRNSSDGFSLAFIQARQDEQFEVEELTRLLEIDLAAAIRAVPDKKTIIIEIAEQRIGAQAQVQQTNAAQNALIQRFPELRNIAPDFAINEQTSTAVASNTLSSLFTPPAVTLPDLSTPGGGRAPFDPASPRLALLLADAADGVRDINDGLIDAMVDALVRDQELTDAQRVQIIQSGGQTAQQIYDALIEAASPNRLNRDSSTLSILELDLRDSTRNLSDELIDAFAEAIERDANLSDSDRLRILRAGGRTIAQLQRALAEAADGASHGGLTELQQLIIDNTLAPRLFIPGASPTGGNEELLEDIQRFLADTAGQTDDAAQGQKLTDITSELITLNALSADLTGTLATNNDALLQAWAQGISDLLGIDLQPETLAELQALLSSTDTITPAVRDSIEALLGIDLQPDTLAELQAILGSTDTITPAVDSAAAQIVEAIGNISITVGGGGGGGAPAGSTPAPEDDSDFLSHEEVFGEPDPFRGHPQFIPPVDSNIESDDDLLEGDDDLSPGTDTYNERQPVIPEPAPELTDDELHSLGISDAPPIVQVTINTQPGEPIPEVVQEAFNRGFFELSE